MYGSMPAAGGDPARRRGARGLAAATAGLTVLAAAACLALLALAGGRGHLQQRGGNALLQVAWRLQQLAEDKHTLTGEDVSFLHHYDQCQSCLVSCEFYEENHCDSFEAKENCLWEQLLAGCDHCAKKGCAPTMKYIATNEALNATFGSNEDGKAAAVFEMAWRDACSNAVVGFSDFEGCIHDASSVAHAENCLKKWLHPIPANMLSLAKKIAAAVGPPQCDRSYTGSECEPAPKPEEHEGSCPQGFMCMPDPDKCEACACSCNTPADKLKNLERCLQRASNPHAGSFCLATFFSQLPPSFVDSAIEGANEPAGSDEHYSQILAACGGEGNGTVIVTKCLEKVEYCVRPIQGEAGTFPQETEKYQQLCECFRDPAVLAECGPSPENATECARAIQEHYVYHVHHKYCVEQTENACKFECEWPLAGFFGDIAKEGPKKGKEDFE